MGGPWLGGPCFAPAGWCWFDGLETDGCQQLQWLPPKITKGPHVCERLINPPKQIKGACLFFHQHKIVIITPRLSPPPPSPPSPPRSPPAPPPPPPPKRTKHRSSSSGETRGGDGTNFCVSLGGELLLRAEELLKEGIHANVSRSFFARRGPCRGGASSLVGYPPVSIVPLVCGFWDTPFFRRFSGNCFLGF